MWSQYGNALKNIQEELALLAVNLPPGVSVKVSDRLRWLIGELGDIASDLDEAVFRQHPDWPQALRVFYGPRLPEGTKK
jgi:hypothetical protein